MDALTRSRITDENATARLAPTALASLLVKANKAGPIGIIVATRPSLGAERETMRSHSSRRMIYSSRSSPPTFAWAWKASRLDL